MLHNSEDCKKFLKPALGKKDKERFLKQMTYRRKRVKVVPRAAAGWSLAAIKQMNSKANSCIYSQCSWCLTNFTVVSQPWWNVNIFSDIQYFLWMPPYDYYYFQSLKTWSFCKFVVWGDMWVEDFFVVQLSWWSYWSAELCCLSSLSAFVLVRDWSILILQRSLRSAACNTVIHMESFHEFSHHFLIFLIFQQDWMLFEYHRRM